MEIKVLEESKNRIVIEIKGEDATLCNTIRKELYNDTSVKNVTFITKHPSVGIPTLTVETSGKLPREALVEAAQRLKKNISSFKKAFEKEV